MQPGITRNPDAIVAYDMEVDSLIRVVVILPRYVIYAEALDPQTV